MKIIPSYVLSNKVYYTNSNGQDILIPDNYVIIGTPQSFTKKAPSVTIIPDEGLLITILIDQVGQLSKVFETINMTNIASFNEFIIALETAFNVIETSVLQANGGQYKGAQIPMSIEAIRQAMNQTFKASGVLINMETALATELPSEDADPSIPLPVPTKEQLKSMEKTAREKLVDTSKALVDSLIIPIQEKITKIKELYETIKELFDKNPESSGATEIKEAIDKLKSLVVQQKEYLRNLSINVQEVNEEEDRDSTMDEIV